MSRRLMAGLTVALIGVTSYVLVQWQMVNQHKREVQCTEARQALKDVQIRARALAAGLSLDAYSQEEEAKVAALIQALDAASNEAEVNAVIAAHAAAIEAEAAAIDAQVDTRGDQVFLEQRRMEQRITVDVKQELQRAAKAVSVTCD
ncbi:hypothetical protein [Pseudomonas sp. IT-P176]|jgi:hypothetical protein|uniref:hypothetical protein n=1 Tax=Pseudomonas sp. IT-P176 TaxID=3026444 RepID=UPI0039E1BB34